jgi:Fic family protein
MTTSKEAKRILAEKRKPMNTDEKMIINNYRAMLFVREEAKNQEMSREKLLELQRIITN